MTLEIRAADANDWPALWEIVEPVVREGETYTYPPDLTSVQARDVWLAEPPGLTVLASSDGQVLGTARLGPNKPGHGDHVGTAGFMVAPAARGKGVARALARYAIEWHRDRGYRGIQFNAVVESNVGAVHLWRSLGWEIIGTVPGAFRSPRYGYVGLHVMYLPLEAQMAPVRPAE